MKINQMQLYAALNEFIDREVVPLGASMDMIQQMLFGVKLGVVKRKAEHIIKKYLNKPEMKLLDLIDENGLIDIDTVYQATMDTLNKVHVVEIGGITFKENDLQNLYGIMQKYANQGVM